VYSLEIVSEKLAEDIENLCLRCLGRHNKSNLNFRNLGRKEKTQVKKFGQHFENSEKLQKASEKDISDIKRSASIQSDSYSIQNSMTLYNELKAAHRELYCYFKRKERRSASKQREKYAGAAD